MTALNSTTPLEWDELWNAMRSSPESRIPTTESMYEDMLDVLPPVAMANGAFLVGEPDHHNSKDEPVYACFMRSGDNFKAQYLTVEQFNKL